MCRHVGHQAHTLENLFCSGLKILKLTYGTSKHYNPELSAPWGRILSLPRLQLPSLQAPHPSQPLHTINVATRPRERHHDTESISSRPQGSAASV